MVTIKNHYCDTFFAYAYVFLMYFKSGIGDIVFCKGLQMRLIFDGLINLLT